MRISLAAILVAIGMFATSPAVASDCDTPDANWLFCEDFEGGDAGWQDWFAQSPFVECLGCPGGTNNPDRIGLTNDAAEVRGGDWALLMPGTGPDFLGGALVYRDCVGEKRQGCALNGHDEMYYRAWVKLAPDHAYVHHFMSMSGTQPDEYWGADGNAGCRPNGYRAVGTTLEARIRDQNEHEMFFYSYSPGMNCDSGGYCSGAYAQSICDGCAGKDMPCNSGLECCWGNTYSADPRPQLPRGEWVCLEMMMRLNTPGQADGEMSFWINEQLGHTQTGMDWRTVSELQLNKISLQHYQEAGDTDQPNRIAWDDVIGSTQRIGCGSAPNPPADDPPTGDMPSGDTTNPGDTTSPGDTTTPGDTTNPGDADPQGDTPNMLVDGDLGGDTGGCSCRVTRSNSTPWLPVAVVLLAVGACIVCRRCG